MASIRYSKWLIVLFACVLSSVLASCSGDDGPSGTAGPGGGGELTGDFVTLSIDGGNAVTSTEASGLPDIDCDPRIDWASNQVVLWSQFTGGGGPSGYDTFLDVMFPVDDAVGTYSVHGDMLQALFYQNGVSYGASPIYPNSAGTVEVTRSDERIEGNFTFTLLDETGTKSLTLTGDFGIDAGWSLSCP